MITPNTFDCFDQSPEATMNKMLEEAFFLPPDVLAMAVDAGWMIPSIQVLSSEEFFAASPMLEQLTEPRYEPSRLTCWAAKKVGVSLRRHAADSKLYVLVKPWLSSKNDSKKDAKVQS